MNSKKKCILIISMHRSGTSSLAGVLNIAGYDLGLDLLPPNASNEKGYFENKNFYDLNNNIFNDIGLNSWDDIKKINIGYHLKPKFAKTKIKIKKTIQEEIGESSLFLIKDPKLCILAPLYIDVLKEMGIDIILISIERDISAIAKSLKRREGFSIYKGFLLTKFHNYMKTKLIDCEFDYNLKFKNFSSNPFLTLKNMEKKLNLTLNIETERHINSFFDNKLIHHSDEMNIFYWIIDKITEKHIKKYI